MPQQMRFLASQGCQLTLREGSLIFQSPYHAGLVMALKSRIPPEGRRWDNNKRIWLIAPQYGGVIAQICLEHLRENIHVPNDGPFKPERQQRILEVRYLGIAKERGGDENIAFGWVDNGWNAIFPENVLRSWFGIDTSPNEKLTLYGILGLRRQATDEEIKTAYRRMARQWHPDVCREPDATEQFKIIQHAHEILSKQRQKYDAGLALEATLGKQSSEFQDLMKGYRAPLRCGLILAGGYDQLERFYVEKIHFWEDIKDSQGRTLVTSWPRGADKFVESWV